MSKADKAKLSKHMKAELAREEAEAARQEQLRAAKALEMIRPITVIVRVVNTAARFRIHAKRSNTVGEVKAIIETTERIALANIRALRFRNYTLEDRWTCYRCGITDDSELSLGLHTLAGPHPTVSAIANGLQPRPGRMPRHGLIRVRPRPDAGRISSREAAAVLARDNVIDCSDMLDPETPMKVTVDLMMLRRLSDDEHLMPAMHFHVGEDGRPPEESSTIAFDELCRISYEGPKNTAKTRSLRPHWDVAFFRHKKTERNSIGARVEVSYLSPGGWLPGARYTLELWGHAYPKSELLSFQRGYVRFQTSGLLRPMPAPRDIPGFPLGSFGESGCLWWIGSQSGLKEYENPAKTWRVKVARTTDGQGFKWQWVDCHKRGQAVHTRNQPNSWMQLDLGPDRSLIPSGYALRHGYPTPTYMLRSWYLLGANAVRVDTAPDGSMGQDAPGEWHVLDRHANDPTFTQGFQIALFGIDKPEEGARPHIYEEPKKEEEVDDEAKEEKDAAEAAAAKAKAAALAVARQASKMGLADEPVSGDTAVEASAAIAAAGGAASAIAPAERKPFSFRYFRLVQVGPNSADNNMLMCAGIELWGELYGYTGPQRDFKAPPKKRKPKVQRKKKAAGVEELEKRIASMDTKSKPAGSGGSASGGDGDGAMGK